MGSAYTIPHEERPVPSPKEDNGFVNPLDGVNDYIKEQNEKLDNKVENMKNSVHSAKKVFREKFEYEKAKANNMERKLHSKVKAFNDSVDNAN